MVFQSYALYPRMTVRKNMAFGLMMQRVPKAEIDARVAEAARILHLEPLLDRRPSDLSGGQRQRVAIGRALVKNVKVFLLTSLCPTSTPSSAASSGSRSSASIAISAPR